MIPLKPFYMIRHGETEANKAQIMAGSLDSPLTETGRNQARAVHKVVQNLSTRPTLIVHSNLSRARDTAHIINEALNIPIIEDADFAEIHAGDLEGVCWSKCTHFDNFIDMPNGEKLDDFFARVRRAKNRILGSNDGPVLIVSHGGVFRAFAKLYGISMPGVRNCHLHEFIPMAGDKAEDKVQDKSAHPSGTGSSNIVTDTQFPWDVFHYDYEERLLRARADSFYKF